METELVSFLDSKFIKDLIPPRITITLRVVFEFFLASKNLVFKNGEIKKLSILNIIVWWKFLNLSYKLINNLYHIWK